MNDSRESGPFQVGTMEIDPAMTVITCPDAASLTAYYAGEVSAGELDTISAHLQDCPACLQRLQGLESGTPFTGLDDTPPSPADHHFAAAVDRLLSLEDNSHIEHVGAGSLLRDYRLLEQIGEGGMGTVFKAIHERLEKTVALKVIRRGAWAGGASLVRFEREMKAVGRLRHPNIVQATDAGEAGGTPFLVMEFVEGENLSKHVKTHGPLKSEQALMLIRQAAQGLQHAHEAGLIHRDIKPSNLMLTPEGNVKILDLGLAVITDDGIAEAFASTSGGGSGPTGTDITSASRAVGTFHYMAPEQRQNAHAVDARADVYGLGTTLWFLLMGQPPRDLTNPPAALSPAVWRKLLADDPAERYASAAEVAQVLAPAPTPAPRNRFGIATVAVVCSAAIIGIMLWKRPADADHSKVPEAVSVSPLPPEVKKEAPKPGTLPMAPAEARQLQKQWGEYLKRPAIETKDNGEQFALIPPGELDLAQQSRFVISKPFFIGVTELTRGEFGRFIQATGIATDADVRKNAEALIWVKQNNSGGTNAIKLPKANWLRPGYSGPTDSHPVTQVSWDDAVKYCEWRSKQEGCVYRLPSHAEFLWACRAGDAGDKPPPPSAASPVSSLQPFAVARGQANAWGLFDATGNVSEWCQDTFGQIPTGRHVDYVCQVPHASRLRRIAGDSYLPMEPSFETHSGYIPEGGRSTIGFRLVREIADLPVLPAPEPVAVLGKLPMTEPEARQLQKTCANTLGENVVVENTIGLKLALIPPGEFGLSSECRVRITNAYRLGTTEVTRGQFRKFVEDSKYVTDSENSGDGGDVFDRSAKYWIVTKRGLTWKDPGVAELTDDHPVMMISHNDAEAFCAWLSRTEKKKYRLPTEAEWTWACRAGSAADRVHSDDPKALGKICWFRNNSNDRPQPVGKLQPNAWGLYDMLGNVNEKCSDGYGNFPVGYFTDYAGAKDTDALVTAGTTFFAATIEMSVRAHGHRISSTTYNGFRVLLELGHSPP